MSWQATIPPPPTPQPSKPIKNLHSVLKHLNLYRPKRNFGQGNIFTPVCHSFCSQGGCGPPGPDRPPPPPGAADTGIRSTFGRYASYWNAFLYLVVATDTLCSCLSLWFKTMVLLWFSGGDEFTEYKFAPSGLFPIPLGRHTKAATVNKVKAKFKFLGKFMAKALMDSRMVSDN